MIQRPLLLAGSLLLAFILGGFSFAYFAGEITRQDIASAAKVAGLEFTDAEMDTVIRGVEQFLESYENNRKLPIDNGLSPALYFNPLPAGYHLPEGPGSVRFTEGIHVRLPEDRNDLAWYTVRELAELIRTRQITSTELTRFFIDRIKANNEVLQYVVTITEETALEQAARADAEIAAGKYRGLLHGIPYGAKDLLATKAYKTTWGAMPYKDQQIDYDATVIERLEAAGAVLIAKTTLGALAMGDVWFGGRTRNPWNIDQGASGSSAGSASAVAAGCLPFAIGTETLGSIVSPSTRCGVTGLRPTYGRISRHGAMALSWSMDKIGPMTRSVEDLAIVFNAIYGPDGKDLHVFDAPFHFDVQADTRKLRVGYLKNAFEGNYPFKTQDSLTLVKMEELGYELIPIELPESPDLRLILNAEAAAAFDELTRSNRDDELVRQAPGAWPNIFRTARFIPAVEYIQANRLRTKLIEEMNKVFQEVDVYLNPSWGSPSLGITNFTGHPCVVLPNGFRNGTPTSITFTGKLFEEGKLLELAKAYQDATDHHKQHPDY